MRLKRETVQKFYCPRCGAHPGRPCFDDQLVERPTLHKARIQKAEILMRRFLEGKGVKVDAPA